jgi:hypothetical protein
MHICRVGNEFTYILGGQRVYKIGLEYIPELTGLGTLTGLYIFKIYLFLVLGNCFEYLPLPVPIVGNYKSFFLVAYVFRSLIAVIW